MRHTRHRADSNHFEILRALSKVTHTRDIHHYGGGMGDILARHVSTQQAVFLEVKSSPKDDLTSLEKDFALSFWKNSVRVNNVDEALAAVGIR